MRHTRPLPWSPYICDVFYPLDIRQATGDKARLNPPNQLCFTVPATLPLYIAYRSPYIFARSTCVQRCRRLHIRTHTHTYDMSLRSCGCAHFRLGYVLGCVKRKHRVEEPISTRRAPALCPRWFLDVDLYESRPVRNFILVARCSREDYCIGDHHCYTAQISRWRCLRTYDEINWKREMVEVKSSRVERYLRRKLNFNAYAKDVYDEAIIYF